FFGKVIERVGGRRQAVGRVITPGAERANAPGAEPNPMGLRAACAGPTVPAWPLRQTKPARPAPDEANSGPRRTNRNGVAPGPSVRRNYHKPKGFGVRAGSGAALLAGGFRGILGRLLLLLGGRGILGLGWVGRLRGIGG